VRAFAHRCKLRNERIVGEFENGHEDVAPVLLRFIEQGEQARAQVAAEESPDLALGRVIQPLFESF